MAAHILLRCGMEPGLPDRRRADDDRAATPPGATGEWLVVEADESDRSMLSLDVDVAVVTNVELDHHATYGSLAELREVFRGSCGRAAGGAVGPPGLLALRGDGPSSPSTCPTPALTRGGLRFQWRGHEVASVPAPTTRERRRGAEACALAGADPAAAAAALATSRGAGRRFQPLGHTLDGARVVDDYAHHPTEVAATIAAARTLAPTARRGLPAAPVLPHARVRARVRRRARPRRRRRPARRLPGARARRGLPGGHAAC